MTTRRKLLIVLSVCGLTAPLASIAQQQGKVWRVGFLSARSRPTFLDSDSYGGFQRGMREIGYAEGKNLVIEWRFADGKVERLPGLAAELVRLKVDVIVTGGTPATTAAQKATTTVPIVMVNVADPVISGFVKSLGRPGSNITGLSIIMGDISTKHLQMLLSMIPRLSRVAVLMNPANSAHATILRNVEAAAEKANIKIMSMEARTPQEIEKAFPMMTRDHARGVIVLPDALLDQQRYQIAELALKHRLPSISAIREYAEAGVLMSYGPNYADNYRRAATHVDKILKGVKPSDLPVEQPTRFEVLINRKTANALGLTIPQELLVSADEVIE